VADYSETKRTREREKDINKSDQLKDGRNEDSEFHGRSSIAEHVAVETETRVTNRWAEARDGLLGFTAIPKQESRPFQPFPAGSDKVAPDQQQGVKVVSR
jgi:hypothetical protein